MALLTVIEEKPDERIRDLIAATIVAAEQEFQPLKFEGEYPDSGLGIGILRPNHLLTVNYWQMSVTTSFADWVNLTLGQNNYILVTGVFNLTLDPSVTEIWPSGNGKQMPYMNIENLYASGSARGWLSKPFAVGPSNNLTIQTVGRIAQTERLGLMGYALGKKSFLLTAAP